MSNAYKKSAKQRISERIKAGKIQERLQKFALSNPTDPDYVDVQMTSQQVTAAKILLGKVVPDLKMVEQIIQDDRQKTREEINDALVAKGIDPDMIWNQVVKH